MSINGNAVGSYSHLGQTFTLVDESGTELIGVVTENEQKFTATADDIKIGKIAATDEGVTEGTDTKTYRTTQGRKLIPAGSDLSIVLSEYNGYDYTKFQCVIASFNTNITNSVSVEKVAINDEVYNVKSIDKISNVTKNNTTKSIDLNIVNDTNNYLVIYFFTYKQEG